MKLTSSEELIKEQTKLTKAKRMREELKYKLESGALIPKAQADREWAERVLNVRSRLLAVPAKLAPQLAMVSPAEAEAVLKREIYTVLKELAESS